MKILVTGASGFVGPYLIQELTKGRHKIFLSSLQPYDLQIGKKLFKSIPCDISDHAATERLIKRFKPNAVIHLAALSQVGQSWRNRSRLIDVNVIATDNLCRSLVRLNRNIVFLYISTAMVYGPSNKKSTALNEFHLPQPVSPYGASKLAAEYVARSYSSDKFKVYVARPFNHTGPGQSTDYVCPALAEKIVQAINGGQILVGNLNSRRDFTDVRDVVRAYRVIIEKQPRENLFVIGSGKAVSISKILQYFILISKKRISTKMDKKLLQPKDLNVLLANNDRARRILGWTPSIPLLKTLTDIYTNFSKIRK